MRKLSYVVAFFAVIGTMILNILSVQRPDWLVTKRPDIIHKEVVVSYGLASRCELRVMEVPAPSGGTLTYTSYDCRPFPKRVEDGCEKENKAFCMIWGTSSYFAELGIGFAVVACLAIIFGVTTHSRRRRIWKSASFLVALHVISQIVAFAIVTDLYRRDSFPTFERARPGLAYVLNVVSWVLGTLVTAGIVITGNAAKHGHQWAAGNRAYRPISG
ncbi:hypothetical protein BD309DRAFT_949156 [Dichomitus squalens]|uniref:Uncharacterized protein n=1 Tax=Dichomitus squalens TaxID=114155 RepID=A0A4Q9P7A6_9APHY|nr:hypothetical protein BD309DRAFT_949156 [Dichomitus squalens]TBU59679.1 hypothetical protein BD310DRAFT_816763 [Dichomitus squalens]